MIFAGLDAPFWLALGRSVSAGILVAGISFAMGWPLGVGIGLARFPFRRLLLALLALPLLLPSFLIAIGLSMLSIHIDGAPAVIWSFCCLGIPWVAFVSFAATFSITRGQMDAARVSSGGAQLFRPALRATRPLALLGAVFAGTFTLADPGPGQIFGWRSAASELLTSFAARHDSALATRQALALTAVVVLIVWPLAVRLAPQVAERILARDASRPAPIRKPAVAAWAMGAASLLAIAPLAGLLSPLCSRSWPLARAWNEVTRTGADTMLYGATAAVAAVSVGFALAFATRQSLAARRRLVAAALALLALPPALAAVWLIPLSGRVTLGLALALRGLPLAILLALRAVGSMPRSWGDAARIHRVRRTVFVSRVVLPWCARWGLPAAAMAALLATSDAGTVLLLHPPGHESLPLAVFTIMANAPEALVAVLCLFYVGLALALAIACQQIVRRP